MTNVKVENMTSSRGNTVPNQFIIYTPKGAYFQSYDSIIALRKNDGSIILDKTYWNYSVTTGRYRNDFLGMNKKETQDLIDCKSIKMKNLNK